MRNEKRQSFEAKESTVLDALNEAEREHWLDSPVSDPWTRTAAFVLDAILIFLGVTGIGNVCSALGLYLSSVTPRNALSWSQALLSDPLFTAAALAVFLKITFVYFFLVWSMTFAGGTPAKLLFGLRVIDDQSGDFPSLPKVLARLLIEWVFIPSSVFAFLHKNRLTLHDSWTGTSVRKVEEDP